MNELTREHFAEKPQPPAEEQEVEIVGKIRARVGDRFIAAEWAKFYIEAGYEVQVTQLVADGDNSVIEGVAW